MALDRNLSSERRRINDMMAMNHSELLMAEETAKRCHENEIKLKTLWNSTATITSQLPREVLAEIFLATLPREELSGPFMSRSLPQEYILARVCKAWREIAWTTPRLWCRIDIRLSKERFEAQKRLIEEWIQRSGKCPLEIRIVSLQFSMATQRWEPPPGAFDIIIQSCTRWKTFISPAFTSLSVALENGVTLGFPLLKTLVLRRSPAMKKPLEKWNFKFPPQLQNLDIKGSIQDRGLAINWGTLTSLTTNILIEPSANDIKDSIPLAVLMICKSLVNLNCDLRTSIVDPNHFLHHFHHTTIRLPHLQKLSFVAKTYIATQFMAITELPALLDLNVSAQTSPEIQFTEDPAWTIALVDWARRSSFRLESLKIWTDNLVQDRHITNMIRQLATFQPLKKLDIDTINSSNFYLSDSLIKELTMNHLGGGEDSQANLPQLGFFAFYGNISFTVSAMTTMLETRERYANLLKESVMQEGSTHDEDQDRNGSVTRNERPPELPRRSGSSDISPQTLTIKINFPNREWLNKQDPNEMRDYYRTVEKFDKDGRRFFMEWERDYETDDSD